MVDATVTHGRTLKDPVLNVPENETIAARLGTVTANVLRTKGYEPLPPVYTVGMTSPGRLEVLFSAPAGTASPGPVLPPFLVAPASAGITDEEARNLFSKANDGLLPEGANPFGPASVVVVSAQGYFISGGARAANVGKVALNTLLIIGMAISGGGGSSDLIAMDKNNLAITFRLFDPVTGALLWADRIEESGAADEAAFAKEISAILAKLPNAAK